MAPSNQQLSTDQLLREFNKARPNRESLKSFLDAISDEDWNRLNAEIPTVEPSNRWDAAAGEPFQDVEARLAVGKKVKEIISDRLDIPVEEVIDELPVRSLGADEADINDILFDLEWEFGLQTNEDLDNRMMSGMIVGQLINYVLEHQGETNAS